MAIGNSDNTSGPFNTNGATTQFAFDFNVASYAGDSVASMLEVLLTSNATGEDTTLVNSTDFSVSVNGDQDASPGGFITTVQTYAAGYKIRIRLLPPFEQATSLQPQGAYSADVVEAQFDHIQRQLNYLLERQDRAIVVPVGESSAALVRAAQRANSALVFDENGDPMAGESTGTAVSAAMTTVVQAATHELAAEAFGIMEVWAEWFGASPSASAAVNAVALQAWIDRCAATGKIGRIGPGVFEVNATIVMKDGARIRGSGSFNWIRDPYAYTDSNPTVIKGSGITGTNSVVFRCSQMEVGVAGSDFSAPATSDLQDIAVRDFHFDANGAQYAAYYYRCGNEGGLYNLSHSGAVVAGAFIAGIFSAKGWVLSAMQNAKGFLIGKDTADTALGAELQCNAMEVFLYASQNSGIAIDGKIGRGSHVRYIAELNGEEPLVADLGSNTGGGVWEQVYTEGNGKGPRITNYNASTSIGSTFRLTYRDRGSGTIYRIAPTLGNDNTTVYTLTGAAGITAGNVYVYKAGVRQTPTTDYTVADNAGDLDITFVVAPTSLERVAIHANSTTTLKPEVLTIEANTTDDGPSESQYWLRIEGPLENLENSFINSNTYKFFVAPEMHEKDARLHYIFRAPERQYVGANFSSRERVLNGAAQLPSIGVTTVADGAFFAHGFYALTQSNDISYETLSLPEAGQAAAHRLTQANASAQRFGFAQVIEAAACQDLRNQECNYQIRLRCSNSQALRWAVLQWTGAADAVTLDVVNNWTSTQYRAGGFFVSSNFGVLAQGELTPSAATWTDARGGTIRFTGGSAHNNLVLVVWTVGTAAQNVTLDWGMISVKRGGQKLKYEPPPYAVEAERARQYPSAWRKQILLRNGQWETLAQSSVQSAHTGDTNETVLATISIPAGAMGANGRVKLRWLVSCTESANVKTIRARLGGIGGTAYCGLALTNQETQRYEIEIGNRNAQNSQVGAYLATSTAWGSTTGTETTSAVDTSAATTLLITGQLASSGEAIRVESYVAEILYAA